MPGMPPVNPRALLKAKTHYIKQDDLRSLLQSDDPERPRVAGTKGTMRLGLGTVPWAQLVDAICRGGVAWQARARMPS